MHALPDLRSPAHKPRVTRPWVALLCGLLMAVLVVTPVLAAPPNAVPFNLSTTEDTAITIDTTIALIAGTSVSIGPATPAHGTAVSGNNGTNYTLTYTPGANQTSSITFQYQLCTTTPTLQCGNPATVSITINPVNDPPIANTDNAVVTEDSANNDISVLVNDNAGPNEDPNTLVLVSVGAASHGTATAVGNSARYTPVANYCGPDSFTYNMRDDSNVVVSAQVNVTVTCVNDAPNAVDDGSVVTPFATVQEDSSFNLLTVRNNDTDLEDLTNALTVSAITTPPAHGDADIISSSVYYTPTKNYCGADSFVYRLTDTGGLNDTATVFVNVACITDPPVLNVVGPSNVDDHTFEVAVTLDSIDVNVAAVQFSLNYPTCLSNPTPVVPAPLSYSDYMNSLGFSAIVFADVAGRQDFAISSNTQIPSILAGPSPATPSRTIVTLRFTVLPACTSGNQANATFGFSNLGFVDTSNSTITGGTGNTKIITVVANTPPTAINLSDSTVDEGVTGDTVGTLTTVDADLPNDSHSYSLNGGADAASFDIAVSTVSELKLKPSVTADFETKSSYTVIVRSTDSFGAFIDRTFTITVNNLNERPIAVDDGTPTPIVVRGSTDILVLANDNDPEGSSISVSAVTNGAHGTVSNGSSKVTYSPSSATYSGLDSFTYTIIDTAPAPLTDAATVNVVVVANVSRGDCDASGAVNVGDIMGIARELFDNAGKPWYMAFDGNYAGSPYGCDATGNQMINLNDITCTAALIFGRTCPVETAAAATALAPASLVIGSDLQAERGATVRVPILLDTGGNAATAASFAVNFSAEQATFATTDADNDGLYDAIELNVRADLFTSVYFNEEANRLEFVLADITDPFLVLADGEIAAVTLTVNADTTADEVAITLSHNELSTESSQLIPVDVTNGAITVSSTEGQNTIRFFIPLISN